MQPRKKPTRSHRVDREPHPQHIEDDTGHLWAVSYADFLMVLLSFFILFFSVNDQDKDAIVDIISNVKEQGLGAGEGGVRSPTSIAPKKTPEDIVHDIQEQLDNIKFEVKNKSNSVVFHFPDDIYRQGSVMPSVSGRQSIKDLVKLLKPYEKEIDMVFVGHTDQVAIRSGKLLGIDTNFDLSALRASRAVRIAMGYGFPKKRLFTHGAADNVRDTKSLSIIVKPRGRGSL